MLTSRNMSWEKPTKLGFLASGRRAKQISWPTPVLSILNRTFGHPYASMSESSVMTWKATECLTASLYWISLLLILHHAALPEASGRRIWRVITHRMHHAIQGKIGHLRISLIGRHYKFYSCCL